MNLKLLNSTFNWFKNTKNRNTFIAITFFAIAFGMVEAAVVIYMRELYYPEGFSFPLQAISSKILLVEMWREAATIIMLLTAGILAGRNKTEWFAYFILSFAVWDIFYYVFLKVFLNWPESFFTWDILFLLPMTWFGPVLAPIILSVLMVVLSLSLLVKQVWPNRKEWVLLIGGSLITIVSFTRDYIHYISANSTRGTTKDHLAISLTYVPQAFDWWIFLLGVIAILIAMILYYVRLSKNQKNLAMMQLFI
jgi:hypothetical protein